MRLRIMVFGLLSVSGAVIAQQSNADYYNEQRNIQQQQWQQEQNRQGYLAAQDVAAAQQIPPPPPRPTGEWIKTWGAIAQSSSNGPQGASVGKLSKVDAENEAIQLCKQGGGAGCKATFAYMNQCIAMSQSIREDGISVIQRAESIDIATQLSMEKCRNRNGSACETVYSACSDPIFRSY